MSQATRRPLPGRGKRRGGAITFWIGLVIALVSVLLAGVLGWRAYEEISTVVDQAEPVEGPTTVTLQQGEAREIYQVEQGVEQADCTVTGPDGQQVPVERTQTIEGSTGEESFFNVGGFQAEQGGDYVVECTGPQTFVGPRIDLFATVGSVFGVVGGLFGLGLGLVLMLVGAILWFVGRSADKRAALGPRSDEGYGPGGPGYQQGYGPPRGGPPGYGPPPPPPRA